MNPAAAVTAARIDPTRFRVSRFALLSVDNLIRDYHFGFRIIVEHLPSGTRVAAAMRTGVAPDLATIVQLVELITSAYYRYRGRIVIEHLPSRT